MTRILLRVLSLTYQYATAFVVIATPLFFIPTKTFSPDVTYYVTITLAIFIALVSYVISAVMTKSWHPISRFEFIAYAVFSASVLLSALFATDKFDIIFGNGVNPYSAVSLLALPAVMYLVRTLPDSFRNRLKEILLMVLAVASLLFLFSFIYSGSFGKYLSNLFSGFSNTSSLVVYVGIIVVSMLVYVKKAKVHISHKSIVAITAVIVGAVLLTLSYSGDTRPNFSSSVTVAKEVLLHNGVFGIGAGNYIPAWQEYRPQVVINSPYFGFDFNQASGTITTFLTTIGIIGTLAFLFLVIGSILFTYRLYRKTHESHEHYRLGVLSMVLFYLLVVSFVIPFSYSILVLWMIIAGFGIAKLPLDEYHPSKKVAFIMIPVAMLFVAHTVFTFQKSMAVVSFNKAQEIAVVSGATDEVEKYLAKAIEAFPYDGFYRAQVEYAIAKEREIVTKEQADPEVLKNTYLAKAQYAVDAGLNAVKANPGNYQNHVSLGRAYELAVPFDKEGGYTRAKKAYTDAIALYPNNPYLYVTLARLEASAGTKEEIRTSLSKALEIKDNFTDALYLMSQLAAFEQKNDEAISYAVKAVYSAPNNPAVYSQAGLLLYGNKNYNDAIYALKQSLILDSTNGNVAFFLALALRDAGDTNSSRLIANELLKGNPSNQDLLNLIKSIDQLEQASSTPATPITSQKAKK
jgi:tetratricopeptide (TPR) repeat protein